MSTTAEALLNIMSVRLAMQESGTTKPQPAVAQATRQFVQELAVLAPSERVDISYTVQPFHATYVRGETGEVLAEIPEREGI